MTKISKEDLVAKYKSKGKKSKLWISPPDKEEAKKLGARWDEELGWYIQTENIENHSLRKFLPENYGIIQTEIKNELKNDLKEYGIFSVKDGDNWLNVVHLENEEGLNVIVALELEFKE